MSLSTSRPLWERVLSVHSEDSDEYRIKIGGILQGTNREVSFCAYALNTIDRPEDPLDDEDENEKRGER